MSSYGSSHSGYLHPSQYPPNLQQHQHPPAPPYPTTPGAPQASQPQAFYPHPPQQQAMYSSSPQQQHQYFSTAHYHQPTYSTSPTSPYHQQLPMPSGPNDHPANHSSPTHHQTHPHSHPPFHPTAPISIHTPQRPPIYARAPHDGSYGSHGSHHSTHMHDAHAFADGEEKYGELDEETLRSYERRYAKDRKLEKRPTLGGSVISAIRAIGGKRE